ncbi:MAG: sensor histidine kinase [Magnetococcales bacterium]|nr:sensor histidine kinase [Magnetococcales bacterium]
MSPHPSIQKHLGIGLASVLIVVATCQWLVVGWMIRHVTQGYVVSRLEHDAENILANLDLSTPDLPILHRGDTIYSQPWSGHYYQVRVEEILLRSRSLWDRELDLSRKNIDSGEPVMAPGPQSQQILIITKSYFKQDKQIVISVAEDMTEMSRKVTALQVGYALISLLATLLLLVLQKWIVRRSLKPLNAAKEKMLRLEQGETGLLSTARIPHEILPFLEAINRLLSILVARLERSRQATGNLAHAIKTPLTILLQLVEGQTLDPCQESREKIKKQIHSIHALTSRELKKVRVAGWDTPMARIDLAAELKALVDVMKQVHHQRQLSIDLRLPARLSALMDREDLLEIAGNLLDNACKWAAGSVRLTVTCDNHWRLLIEDDGPGCGDQYHQHILSHGGRADATIHGHGIGLAVVKEIVEGYEGRIHCGTSPALGGFQVEIVLPLKGVSCHD